MTLRRELEKELCRILGSFIGEFSPLACCALTTSEACQFLFRFVFDQFFLLVVLLSCCFAGTKIDKHVCCDCMHNGCHDDWYLVGIVRIPV